jgi:hypothetical protein
MEYVLRVLLREVLSVPADSPRSILKQRFPIAPTLAAAGKAAAFAAAVALLLSTSLPFK